MVKDTIRNSLAVLGNWEAYPNFVVQVEFKKSTIAYYGVIGSQQFFKPLKNDPEVSRSIERRLGGLSQYVIPRFKNNNIQGNFHLNEEMAKVTYLSSLKESSWYKRFTWN